ncbi:MAG: ABC transporter substrate-binding protein [Chitinophagaceae bacterium]|nr:ABC transporter substrate-binding protein [Chitinophagaceae bacterium]
MKKKRNYLVSLMALALSVCSYAQTEPLPKADSTTSEKRIGVALFTPLFLDSAFDGSLQYRYGKSFPRFINPGLEFYEGAQLAIDSLQKEGISLDVYLYDTRSTKKPVSSVVDNESFDRIDLIIGQANGPETRLLGNAAAKRNIPFINATYPNDAGISNNPNFILLNSTLSTHFTAMYKFIQKNYPVSPIVLFRKKGPQEGLLKGYFDNIANSSSVPLKIKYVTLENDFTAEDLKKHLQENTSANICIAGSLDIPFGLRLTQELASLYEQYPAVVFGMPTWWDVVNLAKPEYKNIEVFFSTPFYLPADHKLANNVQDAFKARFYSRPTDMVYRGYETLYHFAHLLIAHGKNFGSSLSDKNFNLFTDYDIQPVLNPKTMTLDYFENKKIYFVKKVEGVVTEAR